MANLPQQEAGSLVGNEWEMMAAHTALYFHTDPLNLQQSRKVDSVHFGQPQLGNKGRWLPLPEKKKRNLHLGKTMVTFLKPTLKKKFRRSLRPSKSYRCENLESNSVLI